MERVKVPKFLHSTNSSPSINLSSPSAFKTFSSSSPNQPISHIPKIIHQTWKTTIVPDDWKESESEYKRLFPTWEYKLWTDEAMKEFMEKEFNWFMPIYNNYPLNIQRCDAFRYFVLYKMGGLYSDLDIVPTSNFEWFFEDTNSEVFLAKTENIDSTTNCIMASKAGARFWEHTFEWLIKRYYENGWYHKLCYFNITHFNVIFSTGPQLVTAAVRTYHRPITYFPKNIISQNMTNPKMKDNTYTKALYGRSWNRWDSHTISFIYINRYFFYFTYYMTIIYFAYMYMVGKNRCD